jgi:hypothetical protein
MGCEVFFHLGMMKRETAEVIGRTGNHSDGNIALDLAAVYARGPHIGELGENSREQIGRQRPPAILCMRHLLGPTTIKPCLPSRQILIVLSFRFRLTFVSRSFRFGWSRGDPIPSLPVGPDEQQTVNALA